MNYCPINDPNVRKHVEALILWLFDEVKSASGDGDGLWYSEVYNVEDLYPIVVELNSKLSHPSEVEIKGCTISWFYEQECLHITNDEQMYKNHPSWQQVVIKY